MGGAKKIDAVKPQQYEQLMREHECYSGIRVPPGMWTVLRLDGRGFHAVTERMDRPFDTYFHRGMVKAAMALVVDLRPIYAYIQSDEISVAFLPQFDLFGRRVEKLVSIAAGIVSAHLSVDIQKPAGFDGRIWLGAGVDDVVDYFSWRSADCDRNCLNGLAQACLREQGMSPADVHKRLLGVDRKELHILLGLSKFDYGALPSAQKNGSEIFWLGETRRDLCPYPGPVTDVRDDYREAVKNRLLAPQAYGFGGAKGVENE